MKLREVLEKYDFYCYDHELPDRLHHNSRTARVYFGGYTSLPFFEIGRGSGEPACDSAPSFDAFLASEVLDMTVDSFYSDTDMGILFIFLEVDDDN